MYFCKNCGEPYMTDEAVMCVKCGVAKGQGNTPGRLISGLFQARKRRKWTDRILKMKTMLQ